MKKRCPPKSTPMNCETIDNDLFVRACRENGCPKEIYTMPGKKNVWQRYSDERGETGCLYYQNNASENPQPILEPIFKEGENYTSIVSKKIIVNDDSKQICNELFRPKFVEIPGQYGIMYKNLETNVISDTLPRYYELVKKPPSGGRRTRQKKQKKKKGKSRKYRRY